MKNIQKFRCLFLVSAAICLSSCSNGQTTRFGSAPKICGSVSSTRIESSAFFSSMHTVQISVRNKTTKPIWVEISHESFDYKSEGKTIKIASRKEFKLKRVAGLIFISKMVLPGLNIKSEYNLKNFVDFSNGQPIDFDYEKGWFWYDVKINNKYQRIKVR